MKAKVSRGAGFRGLLDYIYGPGEDNHPGRAVPVSGAGNVLGTDPRDLARQFAVSRQLRPDIKKPVWHCSLSLPPGEKLSDERWAEIARDFLSRMGLDPDIRMWHCARHIDTDHDHIHLVVSRVALDASSWGGGNDVHQAIDATQEMEKAHGLKLTPGFKEGGEKKSLSKAEVGRFRRTGKVPDRVNLQKKIDAARKDCPDFLTFVSRLQEKKVQVLPNGKSGQVGGVSFRLVEGGDPFSGSSLGKAYKWQRIAADTHFDAAQDAELIARLRQAATAAEVAGGIGPAGLVQGERPDLYRGRGQVAPEKAREQYFQRQEDGSWTSRRSGWVAFREEENQIIMMSRRDAAIRAGLTTAAEKFGSPLEVSGEDEFRRKAWLLGSQMGLQIKGYEPTTEDLGELAAWCEKHGGPTMPGSIRPAEAEQEVQPSYTLPAEAEERNHYEHDRENEPADRGNRVPGRSGAPGSQSTAADPAALNPATATAPAAYDSRDGGGNAAAVAKSADIAAGDRPGDSRRDPGKDGHAQPSVEIGGESLAVRGKCDEIPASGHGQSVIERGGYADSRIGDGHGGQENQSGGTAIPDRGREDLAADGQGDGRRESGVERDVDEDSHGTQVLRHVPPRAVVELSDFRRNFRACLAAEQAGPDSEQKGGDVRPNLVTSDRSGKTPDREDHRPSAPESTDSDTASEKKIETTPAKKHKAPSQSM